MQSLILDKEKYVLNKEYYDNLIYQFYFDLEGVWYSKDDIDIEDMLVNKPNFYSATLLDKKIVCLCRFVEMDCVKNTYIVRQIDTLNNYKNKGLATNTLLQVDKYLKEKNIDKLIAAVDEKNFASINLHKKCKFINKPRPDYLKDDDYWFWDTALYFEKKLI